MGCGTGNKLAQAVLREHQLMDLLRCTGLGSLTGWHESVGKVKSYAVAIFSTAFW